MKYTKKRPAFPFLEEWIEQSKIDGEIHADIHYGELRGHEKDTIKQALLEDQGFICCYTGHSIDMNGSHIEHIKPQSVCRNEGNLLETLDYNNILAAYPHTPRGYLGEKGCEYGAQARGNAVIAVTPLMDDCERRYTFLASGHIRITDETDSDADLTIRYLKLDHGRLVDIRREIIAEIFSLLQATAINKSELVKSLETLVDNIDKPNSEGKLRAFCFVIRSVVDDTLKRVNSVIPGEDE